MKKLLLAIILFVCATVVMHAQTYPLNSESEAILSNIIFPGYNPAHVVEKSKEKVIKTAPKESYTTVASAPDGTAVVVNATPRIGDRVLQFEGVYWYNISTKQLLAQQKAHVAPQGGKQGVEASKAPRQKGTGATLEQKAQVLGGIYQAVTGRRISGAFSGASDQGGLGNGPIVNQSVGKIY